MGKRRTHGPLRLRRNKHRGKKGRRARFLWPLDIRFSVSRGAAVEIRRLIARLFGVAAVSPVRWDRDEGQKKKKNQPSMCQSGGESEGAKSYGVCLFLVSGSKEIPLGARSEWAHAEAGMLEMIRLCDVFKPTVSELNVPEINPGFYLNCSSH